MSIHDGLVRGIFAVLCRRTNNAPRIILPWLTVRRVPVQIEIVRRECSCSFCSCTEAHLIAVIQGRYYQVGPRNAARSYLPNFAWPPLGIPRIVSCYSFIIRTALIRPDSGTISEGVASKTHYLIAGVQGDVSTGSFWRSYHSSMSSSPGVWLIILPHISGLGSSG